MINAIAGRTLYFARQYDRAIEQSRKALELDRTFARAHWYLGMPYEGKGMYEQAIAEFQQTVSLTGGEPGAIGALGHAYGAAGRRGEAQKALTQFKELSARYVAPFDIALIYAGLGDKNQTIEWLEKAYGDHSQRLVWRRSIHGLTASAKTRAIETCCGA